MFLEWGKVFETFDVIFNVYLMKGLREYNGLLFEVWINSVQYSEELICNIFRRPKGKEGIAIQFNAWKFSWQLFVGRLREGKNLPDGLDCLSYLAGSSKKPLSEFLHIIEIPSSSRREKRCQMLQRLFAIFHHSRNILWMGMKRINENRSCFFKSNIFLICKWNPLCLEIALLLCPLQFN